MSAQLQDETEDLEALFDSVAAASKHAVAAADRSLQEAPAEAVLSRIGKMTRALNDSLRALGSDQILSSAAESIPNTRDRLAYVATMSEKAAERVLNAAETAMPIQESLATDAHALSARWEKALATPPGVEDFKSLVGHTHDFLRRVPGEARATNAQLTEVMLAQDFQDLTGQVIGKVSAVVLELERQLVDLLVENATPAQRQQTEARRQGPAAGGALRAGVMTDQGRVDELLESLGF